MTKLLTRCDINRLILIKSVLITDNIVTYYVTGNLMLATNISCRMLRFCSDIHVRTLHVYGQCICMVKIPYKGATIRFPGGGLGFFWKKYSGSGFGKKKYSGLDHVWKKYLGSIHWKKNVCPLSMKRKCLPSIHEKKMSALYIHENKMLALYKWYYHGSRTNLIFVSLSWSWWRNVGS